MPYGLSCNIEYPISLKLHRVANQAFYLINKAIKLQYYYYTFNILNAATIYGKPSMGENFAF